MTLADGLIMFGLLFFEGLIVLGVTGFIVDRLSRCKWVIEIIKKI